jgi:glucans biosynthesis protein
MHRPSLALAILALVAVGPVLGAQERTKPAAKAPKPPAQGPAKTPATPVKPPAATFDFATVVKKAEKLAARDYKEPPTVPDWLVNITYDQWRDIRFKPDQALWRDQKLPFQVQFFHPGLFYKHPIKVSVVNDDGQATAVPFSPNDFDYGRNDFASKVPQDLGFAGFRVHAPIKTADYYDEVIVFLGASYFRSLGRDQVFGLSARALSIDTAESWGEEFPAFREFWLVEPKPEDKSLTIYALLDSPRVAGAYKFVVTPGL